MKHRYLCLFLVVFLLLSACGDVLTSGGSTDGAIEHVIQEISRLQEATSDHTTPLPEIEAAFATVDSIARELQSPSLSIWTNTQIGFYYYQLTKLEKALPYFLKSSRGITANPTQQLIDPADCLIKNAYFFGNIGDHDLAVNYLSQAVLLVDTTSSAYATIHFALGSEYRSLGNEERAIQHFVFSKEAARDRDPVRYAKALGELALNEKDLMKAEHMLLEDIQLSEMHGDQRNAMFARIRLAKIYVDREEWEEATLLLDRAQAYAAMRTNLTGFEQEITTLKLAVAVASNDRNAQLELHRHLQTINNRLAETDGKEVVMKVNLELQRARAHNDILLKKVKLQQSKVTAIALLSICFLLVVVAIFLRRSKMQALKMHQLKFERIVMNFELEKVKSESKYAQAQQTIQTYVTFLDERNTAIQELNEVVEHLQKSSSTNAQHQRQRLEQLLQEHLMTEENWSRFRTTFMVEYPAFYEHVTRELTGITESQLRIVLLQKLGLNNLMMANLLGVGQDSIKKAKQRLRKKYGDSYERLDNLETDRV
ncbi:tetratricopeptide repeat protein [Sphingobacterium arenae]|uniref:MalT-like TPR region domain-containing protein n=1 Tax=Sphingobacterium arenae TaxID=1280598 RepID=A0ABR7Y7N5_9SPHI|nr:hypothetical protein [Sphingobacterium arenae]MBD1427316.1 hypothetical protein [Sphingobacterium arenae]